MQPYSSIDVTAAWKKLRFILSVMSDFHIIDSLLIAVHAFVNLVSMSFSVDSTLLRDVILKTYLGRWTIGRSGERGSGISVLPARYDDDDYILIGRAHFVSKIGVIPQQHIYGKCSWCYRYRKWTRWYEFKTSMCRRIGKYTHTHTHTHTHIYIYIYIYIYDLKMNSLSVTLFLNERAHKLSLRIFKRFQILIFHTNNFI